MGGRGLRDEVCVAGFLGRVDGLIGLRFWGIFVASVVLFCFVLFCIVLFCIVLVCGFLIFRVGGFAGYASLRVVRLFASSTSFQRQVTV